MAKRYQKSGRPESSPEAAASPGFAEEPGGLQSRATAGEGRWILNIGADGRIVIPAAARAAMLLSGRSKVTARLEDDELRLISPKVALARLQQLIRERDRGQGSIVDELIAERRAEADRE
ncbi:MAG: hypothetical protein ACT4SY_10650 [Hyphomicrobiales bacterium]